MRYTVVVRHPETAIPTAVLAGKSVPEWAKDLVDADDLVSSGDYEDDTLPATTPDAATGEGSEPTKEASGENGGAKPLEEMSGAELKAEIDRRNDGREDDAKLSKSGNKAELIEALKADAATQS